MAATAAIINVNFDSFYTGGCHRIAYRIQGSGDPYTVVTTNCAPFFPPTPSSPCTAQLDIMVDNETCTVVTYEGYVQPCCQDESSLSGRIPFTVSFTPNPECKSYQITCDSVGIFSLVVNTPGSGYTPGATEPVIFTDPAGTLADAECKVEDGGINTFSETIAGVGGPDGTYTNEAVVIGGGNPGAPTGLAYVDYVVAGGVVTSINITSLLQNPVATGSGYVPTNTFTLPGVWGTPPEYTINTIYSGEILVCIVNSPGSGYVGPTTAVTATPGSEVSPVLEVVYEVCGPEPFGTGCDGDTNNVTVPLASTIQICRKGDIGPIPSNMSSVQTGCCAEENCETITITAVDPGYDGFIWYTDCCTKATISPKSMEGGIDPEELPLTISYITGSLLFYPAGSEALLTMTSPAPFNCIT